MELFYIGYKESEKIYSHSNDHVITKDHGIIISHNELKIIFYTLLFTKVYFSVHPVLLKSIIKAALHLTAYNKTFGCNPYTQNIDVMKNKDVELTEWVREREREKESKRYWLSIRLHEI